MIGAGEVVVDGGSAQHVHLLPFEDNGEVVVLEEGIAGEDRDGVGAVGKVEG